MPSRTTQAAAGIADEYRKQIYRLGTPTGDRQIAPWSGLTNLLAFIKTRHICTKPAEISILNIPAQKEPNAERDPTLPVSLKPVPGSHSLLQHLPALDNDTSSSQLIVVENICPDTLALLGGVYDIDPQFFAEHVQVLPWYRLDERVPDRLPSLPSTKKAEDFLSLRYVETRKISASDASSIHAESVLWPDDLETRLRHSAGKLTPVSRDGQEFPLMAFTRQTISVWCRKKTNCSGWIAIMLLDPPFHLERRHGKVLQAEYRSPELRPKMQEAFLGDEYKKSFKLAFSQLLQRRCAEDPMYHRTCTTDAFLVLFEAYRIIASEWLVANEYIKRELTNIEHRLEKTESTFKGLELLLKDLYRIRRRCNKDFELVSEAATQCEKRGQASWPSSKTLSYGDQASIDFAEQHAKDLEEDLKYVLDGMSTNLARVEKNVNLLVALVAISEGRQGLQENRGLALLTLVASLFLPSQTVSTILGLQNDYGPGAENFWVLWAVALPITILVVAIPFSYRTGSAALIRVKERMMFKEKRRRYDEKTHRVKNDVIEMSDSSKSQGLRTAVRTIV